jgi:hypothetical protein
VTVIIVIFEVSLPARRLLILCTVLEVLAIDKLPVEIGGRDFAQGGMRLAQRLRELRRGPLRH